MKKIRAGILAVALVGIVTSVHAQVDGRWKMEIGYRVGIPTGSFKNDFVNNTSFRGAVGEISYGITPKFWLGLSSGFQDYYQKYDRAVYATAPGEHVSAVVTNSMQIIPIMLKGTFMPSALNEAPIKPYVSLGAGLNYINYRQYLGEFPRSENSGNFAAQAGAGVHIPVGNAGTGIMVGANYNYGAYNRNGIENLHALGVHAGVRFNLK